MGVQAVLNLCEDRFCLIGDASISRRSRYCSVGGCCRRISVRQTKKDRANKRRRGQEIGACSFDPHLHPPPRHGEEVRSAFLTFQPPLSAWVRRGVSSPNSLPRLSWGRAGVGVQAVLNLCEDRFCLYATRQSRGGLVIAQSEVAVEEYRCGKRRKTERTSAAEKRQPALARSTPTSILPQDTGEEVRTLDFERADRKGSPTASQPN